MQVEIMCLSCLCECVAKETQVILQCLSGFHYIAIPLHWLYSFPEAACARHDVIGKHFLSSSNVFETLSVLNHCYGSWNRFFHFSMTHCLKTNSFCIVIQIYKPTAHIIVIIIIKIQELNFFRTITYHDS